MTTQELINKCNELYDFAIGAMEKKSELKDVHELFLDVAQLLAYVAKYDPSNRSEYFEKAKVVYAYAQEMLEKGSYNDVYFKIKGIELKDDEASIDLDLPDLNELMKKAEEEQAADTNSGEAEPESTIVEQVETPADYMFKWDDIPDVCFDDVAGLEDVKEQVKLKVLLPLTHPEAYEGLDLKGGGGLLLYGPPGTGKTMIACAIAHEIGAKFCVVKPSDILSTGVGNTEKRIATLFKEASSFPCAVICFDEFESLCPASTHSQISRQVRSEFLTQMQGVNAYSNTGEKNVLFLIAATNKPYDIDSAMLRPGRLGTRVYVGLPDADARRYIFIHAIDKVKEINIYKFPDDIDVDKIVEATDGFNGSDITNIIDEAKRLAGARCVVGNDKIITQEDFEAALSCVKKSVQQEELDKLNEWTKKNNS